MIDYTNVEHLKFNSSDDARDHFREHPVRVPPSDEKRPTELREFYCLQHFFIGYMNNQPEMFPITVIKSESPDFIIATPKETFGLEISEATTSYYKNAKSKKSVPKKYFEEYEPTNKSEEAAKIILCSIQNKGDKISKYKEQVEHCSLYLYLEHEVSYHIYDEVDYQNLLAVLNKVIISNCGFIDVYIQDSHNIIKRNVNDSAWVMLPKGTKPA